ncbi:MAG: YdbH domain-containing protein [Minwuia sp.]|nr:YdbH domain-containing protein [Minwuia sp.]
MTRLRRSAVLFLLGLGIMTVIALAGVLIAGKSLVEVLAVSYLERQGIAPVELDVTALDLSGIGLRGIRIGSGSTPGISVSSLRLDFDGIDLSAVHVQGLWVRASYEGGVLDVGPLSSLLQGPEQPVDSPTLPSTLSLPVGLPPVTIDGAMLNLALSQEFLMLRLDGSYLLDGGRLTGVGPVRLSGSRASGSGTMELAFERDLTGGVVIAAQDVALFPPRFREAIRLDRLDLEMTRQADMLTTDLIAALGTGNLSASLLVAAPFDRPAVDFGVQATLPDTGVLDMLFPPTDRRNGTAGGSLAGGSADMALAMVATAQADLMAFDLSDMLRTASGSVQVTGAVRLPADAHPLHQYLGTADLDLSMSGRIRNGEMDFKINELSGKADLVSENLSVSGVSILHDGTVTFRATSEQSGSVAMGAKPSATLNGAVQVSSPPLRLDGNLGTVNISERGLELLNADLQLSGLALSGLSLAGQALPEMSLQQVRYGGHIRIAQTLGLLGKLEAGTGTLALGAATAEGAKVALDLDLAAESAVRYRLRLNGQLQAGTMSAADDAVELVRPRLELENITLARVPGKGIDLAGVITASAGSLSLVDLDENQLTFNPLRAEFDVDGHDFGSLFGTLDLRSEGIDGSGFGRTGVIDIRGRVLPSPQSLSARVSVADIRFGAADLDLPPLAFAGEMQATAEAGSLSGKLGTGSVVVDLTAGTNQAAGVPAASLTLPQTSLPLLSDLLRDVLLPADMALPEGTVSGVVNLVLGDPLHADLELDLANGSVAMQEAALAGINTRLRLESLLPPRTAGSQTVRIALLSGPADMRDIVLQFELAQDDDETIARVLDLHGDLLGGRMAMQPFELRQDETRRMIAVGLTHIDMAEIVDLAGLEDFILTGSLSGTLPVEIVGESGVVVRQGRLVADGPGTLRLDGDVLRGILGQQGGEEIDLMIRTLEDFRYDLLEVSLDKPLQGETKMLVTLGGLNPAVLDGHPFRFNISVSGDADRLLATILTVYRASSGVIEQGIKSLQ